MALYISRFTPLEKAFGHYYNIIMLKASIQVYILKHSFPVINYSNNINPFFCSLTGESTG